MCFFARFVCFLLLGITSEAMDRLECARTKQISVLLVRCFTSSGGRGGERLVTDRTVHHTGMGVVGLSLRGWMTERKAADFGRLPPPRFVVKFATSTYHTMPRSVACSIYASSDGTDMLHAAVLFCLLDLLAFLFLLLFIYIFLHRGEFRARKKHFGRPWLAAVCLSVQTGKRKSEDRAQAAGSSSGFAFVSLSGEAPSDEEWAPARRSADTLLCLCVIPPVPSRTDDCGEWRGLHPRSCIWIGEFFVFVFCFLTYKRKLGQ